MEKFELIIVGGGLTAARAIREYREAGGSGRIALISREASLPYHRPPLSKRYLRGEIEVEQTLVEPEEFYAEHGVELLLGTEVTAVDTREQVVAGLRYGKLLIATGSRPPRLRDKDSVEDPDQEQRAYPHSPSDLPDGSRPAHTSPQIDWRWATPACTSSTGTPGLISKTLMCSGRTNGLSAA